MRFEGIVTVGFLAQYTNISAQNTVYTVTQHRIADTTSRRALLTTGAGTVASLLAGCITDSGPTVDVRQFDEADPLVTHDRVGKGATAIPYLTSQFYMPAQSGNNQPELSPLTGPFYKTLKQQHAQPAAAPAIRAQHETWARANPDYRISLTYQSSEQWRTELTTRAAAGTAPAGSTLDSFWAPDLYEYLQPLDDYVTDINDFFPFVRQTAVHNGQLLAAWKYTGCTCLYYRQDLIDRYSDGTPPRTWADLVAVGQDIAAGKPDIIPFLFRNGAFENLPYFWGQGGSLVNADGAPVIDQTPNRRALLRTLSFLRELITTGVTPKEVASISTVETLSRYGRNDRVAMFLGNNDQIERGFKNQVDDDRWRRWRVAPIPMRSPDQYATGVGGFAEGSFLPGGTGAAAALKRFVAMFVDPVAMGRYCETAALLPTRQSLYDTPELYDPDTPYQDQFRQFLDYGIARPAVPIYTTIADAYQTAITAVITGEATPESAVETMITTVMDTYKRQY